MRSGRPGNQAAAHPRRLRMLRGACALAGGREDAIAALDRQFALTVAGCHASMPPEDGARVQSGTAP